MRGSLRSDAGFSLLEMLVVLAVMALAMTLVMPSGAVMLDRATAHSVFFDFQRQVSDLRLRAYRNETAVTLEPAPVPGVEPIRLRTGWSYRLDAPVRISDGGACSAGLATLFRDGRPVMRLRTTGAACRFERLS